MVSSGHMDVTVHCCSSFVVQGQTLLGTGNSCQMGQFDPWFTTLERVTDNESVKSMVPCSVLYVMGSSGRNVSKAFMSECLSPWCVPFLKSIALLLQHKVARIHQQINPTLKNDLRLQR